MNTIATRKTCISILIIALCAQLGCTTNRTKHFEAALDGGRCEEDLEYIPEDGGALRFIGKANQTAGTALSYAATGVGYTADVAVTVVGGSVILIALCSPLVLASASGVPVSYSETRHHANMCFPTPSGLRLPAMGAAAYRTTAELRCPDLTSLSKSMRRVAACEERKNQIIAFERAKQTLITIEGNADFLTCVSSEEKIAVRTDLARLREKIERLPETLMNEASIRY